ncbi:uncharacterized protein LOC111796933 [Cucurbita pepo subsp. pepo]|uniref:uncharacterized protein LOC111796933 n=1 Tax=Cucurbita pepo subsp. pepo TaxID=3664 RepID=UPI000C9D7F20|nr:uncharacterized protein LOC111796933 [Cucurbita pepo subsp. pepo]
MLASLTDEQDGAAPFDLDDGAVAEFHRPTDPRVELGERRSSPGHMVCCPCVKDPLPVLVLLVPFADLSEHSLLLQLNWLPSWCHLCYAQLELFLGFNIVVGFGIETGDACSYHEESWLVLLGLSHMGLFGLLLIPELAPAISAQVSSLPTVRALDRPAIGRLLLLIPIFPARAPVRHPWLLTAFAAGGGPVALAGVVAEL